MCEIKRLRDMKPGDRFLCTLPNLLGECELVYHHAGQFSYVSLIGSEGVVLVCSNTSVVVCTERDELKAELEQTIEIKNQVVKNCNEWRGIAQDRTEELDVTAGHVADCWLYLDAWARSDSVTIEDVKEICKTLLRKQQAPGWKDGE